MRDPDTFQVVRPFSLREIEDAERQYQEKIDDFSLFDAVSGAFREQNTLATVFNNTVGYEPDETFELENYFSELTQDLPEDRWDIYEEAASLEHARKLKERVQQSIKDREVLSSYGWTGTMLELGSAVVDLPAIAATIATEGALGPAIWGAKATRLGRAFRTASTAGVASAGIEAYLVAQNPNKDPYDILYAMGGGFLLGGAVGATRLGIRKEDVAMIEASKKLQRDAHNAQVSEVASQMKSQGLDPEIDIPQNPFDDTGNFTLSRDASVLAEEYEGKAMADFGFVRLDSAGILKKSESNIIRMFADIGLEDAVNPGAFTADLEARVIKEGSVGKFQKNYPKHFSSWAKKNGFGALQRNFFPEKARRAFGTEVSRHIELSNSTVKEVVDAATTSRQILSSLLKQAKDANVKGFEYVPEDLTYFTHIWNGHKFRAMGEEIAQEVLTKSILSANRGLEEDLAKKISKGMVRKIIDREMGIDVDLARIFSTSNKNVLREMLLNELDESGLTTKDIDRIINQLDFDREGVPARAKRRMKVDISTKIEKDGKVYSIEDLMERDAELVIGSYINQMAGRIAFAKRGITSDADFKALMSNALKEARDKGLDVDKVKKETELAEIFYTLITGRPRRDVADPASTQMRVLRAFMDYNFIRYMGQVGLAQLAEFGNAVSIDGFSGFLRAMPDFKKIMKRGADGELEDSVQRDLEQFSSIGLDAVVQRHLDRLSYEDDFVVGPGQNVVQKSIETARGVIAPLRNFTANASGLVPITVFLERTAARIALQTIVDLATGVKKRGLRRVITKGTYEDDVRRRLNMLGLDDDMTKRVFNQINKKAVLVDSFFGPKRKIKAINMTKWDDQDAAEALGLAIARWTRQSIQKNDYGNLHPFMTRPLGQLLLQFRSFMIVSHAKQFLHNIKRNDFMAYQAMATSIMFGTMGYMMQTYINSVGRRDRKEFLAERLLTEDGDLDIAKIASQGFARSSWSAFFPGAIDTTLLIGQYDPVFGYSRSSGLASDFIKGTIPVSTVDDTIKALQGVATLTGISNSDYQFSQSHAKAIKSLAPLHNAYGIRNVFDALVEKAPETSKIR